MTSLEEQAYCRWFASQLYQGVGEWIELGTFLGSLTIPSVQGLEANPRPAVHGRKVRVFDLFYWDRVMAACVKGTPFEGCCQLGERYLDLYRRTIGSVIHRVQVNEADLSTYEYSGESIEYLVVDVMKAEPLVHNVLKEFFVHLLPDVGHVFHQDYLHFYEGWITLSMYNLREHFDKVHETGASVAFRCSKAIPVGKAVFPLDSQAISREWIDEAFDWSYSIIGEPHHHEVAATKIMMLIHTGRWEEARRLYREGCLKYPSSYSFKWLFDYIKDDRGIDLTT